MTVLAAQIFIFCSRWQGRTQSAGCLILASEEAIKTTFSVLFSQLKNTAQRCDATFLVSANKQGYMTASLWATFIEDVVVPHLKRNNLQRGLLLFDGYKCHVIDSMREKIYVHDGVEVLLMLLPAGATSWACPLDQHVFKAFKSKFTKSSKAMANDGVNIVQETVILAIKSAWGAATAPSTVRSSWATTGLWNADIGGPDYRRIMSHAKNRPFPVEVS